MLRDRNCCRIGRADRICPMGSISHQPVVAISFGNNSYISRRGLTRRELSKLDQRAKAAAGVEVASGTSMSFVCLRLENCTDQDCALRARSALHWVINVRRVLYPTAVPTAIGNSTDAAAFSNTAAGIVI